MEILYIDNGYICKGNNETAARYWLLTASLKTNPKRSPILTVSLRRSAVSVDLAFSVSPRLRGGFVLDFLAQKRFFFRVPGLVVRTYISTTSPKI